MERIHGYFESSKGVTWHYTIHEDGYADMWHENIVKAPGGWKRGNDTMKPATKELIKFIKEHHGIDAHGDDTYEEEIPIKKHPLRFSYYPHYGRGYKNRIVYEDVNEKILMIKNGRWEGIGNIEYIDGKPIVHLWGHGGYTYMSDPTHTYEIIPYGAN